MSHFFMSHTGKTTTGTKLTKRRHKKEKKKKNRGNSHDGPCDNPNFYCHGRKKH